MSPTSTVLPELETTAWGLLPLRPWRCPHFLGTATQEMVFTEKTRPWLERGLVPLVAVALGAAFGVAWTAGTTPRK
ncbi:hypothetical protein Taro_056757 [Colocasia esculenta]|uniref:Uncharacterized protein n=1 Tax=Colocasia esculenta TaxID=4460 RepID=A0A843XXN2_COLES|nr:hypothetical protein [Colocasia esculenta]